MGKFRLVHGRIVDGTGKPPFLGIVEVNGNRITTVTSEPHLQGAELPSYDGDEIDCKGLIISPGFIDVHAHTDFNILADSIQAEKLSQGITTVLGGNCGLGLFPLNAEVTRYYSLYGRQLFGLENPPLFQSAKDFLDAIVKNGAPGINFGTLIPQGNIRAVVMGGDSSPASSDQIRLMQDAIGRNMDEGAFGLSAGLIYPPGFYTGTTELIELCRIVAHKGGIFACHTRDEANHVLDSIREMEQIQQATGCRVQISHLKIGASINARKIKPVSNKFRSFLENNTPITADLYPYGWGFTSLSAIALPPWVFEGTDAEIRTRLANPEIQTQLIREFINKMVELAGIPLLQKIPQGLLLKIAAMVFARIARIVGLKNHPERQGMMLGSYLNRYYPRGTFFERVLQMLIDEDCAITFAMKTMDDKKVLEPLWTLPNVMMGTDSMTPLSNMGSHPRIYGSTGVILGTFTRDHRLISLEQAVHKMTGLSASVFQIEQRGILQPGYFADIVLFDPLRVKAYANFENCRLHTEGIRSVFVNGTLAWNEDRHIASAGIVLRKTNLSDNK